MHQFYCRDEDGGEFTLTKQILDELGVPHATLEECGYVRKICQAVSERAAFLASAGNLVFVSELRSLHKHF